jgi:hypothetical protein
MADLAGEADSGALRLDFDRRGMLRFHGSAIISDCCWRIANLMTCSH